MNRRRRLTAIAATASAAAMAAATAMLLSPTASAQGETLWTNPETQAALWVAQNPSDSRAALIQERLVNTPQGNWFTQTEPEGGIEQQVAEVVSGAAAEGAAPVMVVYNIPNRDCAGASSGGAPSHAVYRDWIDRFASELSGPAYIVLEPDVLPLGCDGSDPEQVSQSIGYAAQTLKAADPQAHVYIDIGHSAWLPADTAASMLQGAGLQYADGFSINVSNYRTTEEAIGYAHDIQGIVGSDKGAVIDTSRNGNGPLDPPEPNDWCDPPGRAIGDYPTTSPGVDGIDALLWVKLPGEADGCAGGAGQFIPDLAYTLANNAGPDWPGDIGTDPPTSDVPTSGDPTTGGPTEGDCTAEIVVVSSWNGGWQGEVRVTAGADALDGWTLTWDWPGGQDITSSWNVDIGQSGQTVTASDVGWNGAIASGETRDAFGFIGTGSSASPQIECGA
ncbi:glycoside hydrolase family 6 protein [Glycomyces sp. L485]|uniref:glycoside hydrolase family 6 protein n=1 Tax=Glycomyces sp. L485 TaxID=2909235 RepID=UPI001F4A6650|nr:glycoside hydrolase family 6 protein [Glycomyces sp. L485]MCH7230041.1 glycoside hydrolase family 6 protein [Glycomyces sp. L485]